MPIEARRQLPTIPDDGSVSITIDLDDEAKTIPKRRGHRRAAVED
jgi:hypothetical protein